jgi:PTH1 family peptidyl-tRNA hydrolase
VKIIAGLGNPGPEHRGSRHNVGFGVVEGLAREYGIGLRAGRGDFVSGRGSIGGTAVELVLPLTYMNRSGDAVALVLEQRGTSIGDLIVVCDDVDLPLGRLRLRRAGGDGGHRGLKSIIERLESQEFARLRLGVGRPPEGTETSDYVLDGFLPNEVETVEDMKARAIDGVVLILTEGVDAAMNTVNQRRDSEQDTDAEEARWES